MKSAVAVIWGLPALCFSVIVVLVLTEIMGKDTIFAFHPLAMTAAFMLCFSYGIISYRMDVLGVHQDELGVPKPMEDLRERHQIWQIAGSIAATIGLIAVVVSKLSDGDPLFEVPSLHAVIGSLALCGIILQGVVGYLKMKSIKETGEKIYSWHGNLGYGTFTLGILATILGANLVWGHGAEFWVVSVVAVAVATLVLVLRFTVNYPGAAGSYTTIK